MSNSASDIIVTVNTIHTFWKRWLLFRFLIYASAGGRQIAKTTTIQRYT